MSSGMVIAHKEGMMGSRKYFPGVIERRFAYHPWMRYERKRFKREVQLVNDIYAQVTGEHGLAEIFRIACESSRISKVIITGGVSWWECNKPHKNRRV